MEGKSLFESKHCLSLKCVLFLFYGGLGCIYPFLQSNMAHKGFDYNEIYSISVIIPIAALFGPLVFALLVDKWATTSAFAYGKRVRILTALSLIASIVLYVVLMFGVSRTPPPEVCTPQVSFMCNKKGAYLMQEKCTSEGVCHDWDHNKVGLLNLEHCTYSCQREAQFESNCYERQEQAIRMAAIHDLDDGDDDGDVVDESELVRTDDGSGSSEGGTAKSNDLDGDGIPNDQDPDDDNDGIPDSQDDDDDNDGVPDAQDMDDDNDGVPDSMDPDSKMTANDLDGDGIPNDQDDDDDNDGIPDAQDPDDDNDGVPDAQDTDDDNDGIPDIRDKDSLSKHNDLDGDDVDDDDDDNDGIPDAEDLDDDNDGIPDDKEGQPLSDDLDGDGIPNDQDEDDDNDGVPDTEDKDDDNDGIPDSEDIDDDNDGIPDVLDENSRNINDLDGDGVPNDQDDDDDNDGIPDADDNDDDNDGIPDSIDDDDDNDGILDTKENLAKEFAAPQICHDPAADNSEEDEDDDEKCHTFSGEVIEVKASIDEHNERDDVEECVYPLDGFKCQIDKAWVKAQEHGCKPVIECSLREPYADNSSLLYGTSCDGDEDNDGDDDRGDSTYYFYMSIRSLLDFFLLSALTLFNTIIVIATRDASTGVADFGRQLVWGAIGWIVFFNDDFEQPYFIFIILNTTAIVILLSPLQMDLSPPEEWWKFKTTPQKFFSSPAFVKYAKKCWLPFLVTVGLGSLWSIIDSIDESHMIDIPSDDVVDDPKKATVMRTLWKTLLLAGDLLAIPVLVFSKRIIEVFGTCKILVSAFLSLVVRYILLAIFDWHFWDIIEDWLLPTTLGLTWVTLVLHFRDAMPRKATAIAQALPVVAHFCFGRFFGALIGIENDYDHLENDYEVIAGVLFGVTIVSIVLYRYREIVLTHVGQYIPALKPCEKEKVEKNGKGETDV